MKRLTMVIGLMLGLFLSGMIITQTQAKASKGKGTEIEIASAFDLGGILGEIIRGKVQEPFKSETPKRERDPEEKRLSFLAREIFEGRIPSEIKNKYAGRTRTVFSAEGRVIGNDTLELPPYIKARVKMRSYCLDRPLPAPASREKMRLIPISKVLISEFIPIYGRLMVYSASHPENHLQIQRIVWFMRFLSEEMYVPSFDLVYEDRNLLETIYPGSTRIIDNRKEKILVKQQITKLTDVLLDRALPPEIKGVLRQLSNLGYDINNPPRNLSTANDIASRMLQVINTTRPEGVIEEDNSEYTLLPNDIAVKTEHPGGMSRTVLWVANPTPEVKTLDFKEYVLEPGRNAQKLGLGGIEPPVDWEKSPTAPFCIPSAGTLGYRYSYDLATKKGHGGIDIWTGDAGTDSDVTPPGNPVYLPYPGILRGFVRAKNNNTVQGLIFRHNIDESYKGVVPDLEVETIYLHMAIEETRESLVNKELKVDTEYPRGTFLGYQGNQRWNDKDPKEKIITHLHFAMRFLKDFPNNDPSRYLLPPYRDPSSYLGYNVNVDEGGDDLLPQGFRFPDERVCK